MVHASQKDLVPSNRTLELLLHVFSCNHTKVILKQQSFEVGNKPSENIKLSASTKIHIQQRLAQDFAFTDLKSIFLQDNCGSYLSLPTASSAAHVVRGILCFRSIRPSTECCHVSTSERVCTVGLLSHHLHFLSPYSLLDHLMKELLSPFFLEIFSRTTAQTMCPGAFRSSLVIKLVIEGA